MQRSSSPPNRRELLGALAATPLALQACGGSATASSSNASSAPASDSNANAPLGGGRDLLFVAYPGMTALDLVGPINALYGLMLNGYRSHVVAANLENITTDTRYGVFPTLTLDQSPNEAAVVLLPGGTAGTVAAMQNPTLLDWLRRMAPQTRFMTSVCTGSLILGAAGLLQGKRATSHWAVRDQLSAFGATPIDERVVFDGATVTGAGVSAGIDLGLQLCARLGDETLAQAVQLSMEYDPQPPFQTGSVDTAPPPVVQQLRDMYAPFREKVAQAMMAKL